MVKTQLSLLATLEGTGFQLTSLAQDSKPLFCTNFHNFNLASYYCFFMVWVI